MAGMTKSLKQLLYKTEQMISNGQSHPDVSAAMAVYGYDAVRWGEGQALVDAVKAAVQTNAEAHAAQLGATDAFHALYDEVWDQSQDLARLCANLFGGDTEALSLLGLHQRRDKTMSASELAWPTDRGLTEFLPWARNLYKTAESNDAIANQLATFGYPTTRLSEEAAELADLTQADNVQEIAKAESQQSIIARDNAVDALQAWSRQTEMIAKMALKDDRQLLELMGLRAQKR